MKKERITATNTADTPQTNENREIGISVNKKTIVFILLLLAAILVGAGVLTQVMPTGVYDMDETGAIIDGTYHLIDGRLPIWKIILSPLLCFTSSTAAAGIGIIAIIILVGGSFLLLDKSGVLKYIMAALVKKYKSRRYMLMAIVCFACMALSSTAGVLEESVTLVPLAVAVSLAMGWDSLVGLGLSLVSVAWGFTAATFNPFNVVTCQKLSGLGVYSGLWLRFVVFALVYGVLYLFLFTYAKRIEKDPKKSVVYETDKKLKERFSVSDVDTVLQNAQAKKSTRAFLICMAIDLVCIVVDLVADLGGVLSLGAMAILFTTGGLLAGRNMGLRGKTLGKNFFAGVKTLAPVVPLVVFVIAISYILNEGNIMHTILNKVYNLMQGMHPVGAVFILFLLIAVLEFFIGSGTAKAFLIMPIVAPLSDLVGITRQSVVTTFCLADGFTNLLYPTSGIMIIAIGLIGVSYGKWLKWSWKLFLGEFVISAALMVFMVVTGYN